jgi:hypothetical protein
MMEQAQQIAGRAVGIITDDMLLVAGVMAVASLAAVGWTQFRKPRLKQLSDATYKIRREAFLAAAVCCACLLYIWTPWASVTELLVRIAVFAPLTGVLTPISYDLIVSRIERWRA